MARDRHRRGGSAGEEAGQASLLLLGVLAAVLAGVLILFAFGQALGAKGKHQRGADLAAVSAAQVMSRNYARLFEPAFLEGGIPNPHHLSNAEYLAMARAAALRGARRNGVPPHRVEVSFPGALFAPTRVAVSVHGEAEVRLPTRARRERVEVRARAAAEIAPDLGASFGMPTHGSGGGYDGPLAYRMGKPTPDLFPRLELKLGPSAPALPCAWGLNRATAPNGCRVPNDPGAFEQQQCWRVSRRTSWSKEPAGYALPHSWKRLGNAG